MRRSPLPARRCRATFFGQTDRDQNDDGAAQRGAIRVSAPPTANYRTGIHHAADHTVRWRGSQPSRIRLSNLAMAAAGGPYGILIEAQTAVHPSGRGYDRAVKYEVTMYRNGADNTFVGELPELPGRRPERR